MKPGRRRGASTCRPAIGLAAVDRALLVRELVRAVAHREDLRASFTPMIAPEGFGNGVHVHFSLRDLSGAPVSYDPAAPGGVAATAGSFVAGILRHLPPIHGAVSGLLSAPGAGPLGRRRRLSSASPPISAIPSGRRWA